MEFLNFNKPHTAYQDREGRDVCGGCGTYYVVSPEQLKRAQEITSNLYEALKALQKVFHLENVTEELMELPMGWRKAIKALAKADVKYT